MAAFNGSYEGEFFVLGEEYGLYEEFVPRENFAEQEIQAKRSRRYFSADGYIDACPVGIATLRITLSELARFFEPTLQLTERVVSCEGNLGLDDDLTNAFALIQPKNPNLVKSGLYGRHKDGVVTSLYGSGVRHCDDFVKSIAPPLADLCSVHRLILLLHNEYPLDVSDPRELLRPENEDLG